MLLIKKLQELDKKIDELSKRLAELPERRELEQLESTLGEAEATLAKKAEELDYQTKSQKRLEDEVNGLSEKIAREKKKLYSGTVQNPKELSGIEQEIKSLQKMMDEKETGLLEQMVRVEELTGAEDSMRSKTEELRNRHADLSTKVRDLIRSLEAERADFQKERDSVEACIDQATLDIYKRVRDKYAIAVCEFTDGICQGCRVALPAEDVDQMRESEESWRCPTCGRILVK